MKKAAPEGVRCRDRAMWRSFGPAVILLGLYGGLAIGVQEGSLRGADWSLLRLAQATTSPSLDRVMSLVSFLGTVQFTIPAFVVLCATAREEGRLARFVPLLVILVLTAAELMSKEVITQPGPSVGSHHPIDGSLSVVTRYAFLAPYAFPSGGVPGAV